MPELVQQPEQEPAPPTSGAARPKDTTGQAKISELKKKYCLDTEVNILAAGPDGRPMGWGPIMAEDVFNRFAALDHTRSKKYLDWMLFQAGGGSKAFDVSRKNWGDEIAEVPPEYFYDKFKKEVPNHAVGYEETRLMIEKLGKKGLDFPNLLHIYEQIEAATQTEDLHQRYEKLLELLTSTHTAPGKERRVAVEIIGNKFKVWIKKQRASTTRDRVHATSIYSRLIRGMSREEAELRWKEMEPKLRKDYLFGDQDSRTWEAFGYNRYWPGRNGIYERVYSQMKLFLANKDAMESYNDRLDTYNERIKQKNKQLPPEQQLPLQKGLRINLNIGRVVADAQGNLSYKGKFKTINDLTEINSQITNLPMRERIAQDIRYSGVKGRRSKSEKVYSDANLDVFAPLTVGAAVEAGHTNWPVSDPEQISQLTATGDYSISQWTKYATGKHGTLEWENIPAISLFFHVKTPGIPPDKNRLWLVAYLYDLVDLRPPYEATEWRFPDRPKMTYTDLLRDLKTTFDQQNPQDRQNYLSLVKSMGQAMRALKAWGEEFDPQDIIPDYVKHHREKMTSKRSFEENLRIRAAQVIEALME